MICWTEKREGTLIIMIPHVRDDLLRSASKSSLSADRQDNNQGSFLNLLELNLKPQTSNFKQTLKTLTFSPINIKPSFCKFAPKAMINEV